MNTITKTENSRLHQLEIVIEEGKQTFVTVGNALGEIRDSKLYREKFGTFEDYCKERWGFSRFYAHRIIEAYEVSKLLPNGNKIPNEATAREVAKVPAEKREEVIKEAIKATDGNITAKSIKDAAEEIKQTYEPGMIPESKMDSIMKNAEEAENESEVLFHLKSYWKKATKKDKKEFMTWIK